MMTKVRQTSSLIVGIAAAAVMIGGAAVNADDQPRGPELAVVSNMSQGSVPGLLLAARDLGISDFRDGVDWGRLEPAPGTFAFTDIRVRFPDEVGASGATASLVLNWGNDLYQDGATPTQDDAIAAFGRMAGALMERFPAVDSLEIGNEFNGVNFVRGPIADMTPQDRALAYVDLLAAAAEQARAVRPDIRILGGATHSIAAGYIWTVLDAGAAEWMDTLAIHPYTTPPELLVSQLAVLRRHPVAAKLPIEVTEFGSEVEATAAGDFLMQYCQMALGGVTRAVWYPLHPRGDGFAALLTRDGQVTEVGQAWAFAAMRMEGRPVADAAIDDFSYGCRFGDDIMVLWGPERQVTVLPGVQMLNAAGRSIEAPAIISPETPLVFFDPGGAVATKLTLGPTTLIADSFHQFAYPLDDELQADGDGFERFILTNGRERPLRTFPGQDRRGVPWYPYRSNANFPVTRLTQSSMVPGGRDTQPRMIVHRWTAPEAMSVDVMAQFDPSDRSKDGIAVDVLKDDAQLLSRQGKDVIEFDATALDVVAGEQLVFQVGPNGSADGDLTGYRITIRRTEPDAG